jgi:hypothetical protein
VKPCRIGWDETGQHRRRKNKIPASLEERGETQSPVLSIWNGGGRILQP